MRKYARGNKKKRRNSDEINLVNFIVGSAKNLFFRFHIKMMHCARTDEMKRKFAKIIKKRNKTKIEVLINNSSQRNQFSVEAVNGQWNENILQISDSIILSRNELFMNFQGNLFFGPERLLILVLLGNNVGNGLNYLVGKSWGGLLVMKCMGMRKMFQSSFKNFELGKCEIRRNLFQTNWTVFDRITKPGEFCRVPLTFCAMLISIYSMETRNRI